MTTIESRLDQVEREFRRSKLVSRTALAVIVGFMLCGAGHGDPQDLVQARKFELVNKDGRVVARLESDPGGFANLSTFDPQGKVLVQVWRNLAGAGGVFLFDSDGKKTLELTSTPGGGGSLAINNNAEHQICVINRNALNAGTMRLLNANGKIIMNVASDSNSAGAIVTYDGDGKQTARMPP